MEQVRRIAEQQQDSVLHNWSIDSSSDHSLRAMARLAIVKMQQIEPAELNRHPHLLNMLNGTIDLRSGEMQAHDPKHLITQLAPFEYDAEAKCPWFEECLREWMLGDTDMAAFMQRYAGLLITGEVSQTFFIHHGGGQNGKSQFFCVLRDLLGADYAGVAPRKLLVVKRNEPHPTEMMELHGQRLVVAVESDSGDKLDMG